LSEYRRQILIGGVVAVIVGIILIASIAYLPLIGSTTSSKSSSTTSSASTFSKTSSQTSTTTYSNTASSGLQLQINLNTTQIEYGGHLSVKVELFNPPSSNLSLNVSYSSDQTILNWNSRDFLCSLNPVDDLFGFALYQGYYTSQNASSASPLLLAPEAAIGCPTFYQPNVSKITVAPGSDSANLSNGNSINLEFNATTENCYETQGGAVTIVNSQNGTTTTYTTQEPGSECGGGPSLYGYWTKAPVNQSCTQVPLANETVATSMLGPYCNLASFPVGSYTLVAQDLWNQTVYAYFDVVNTLPGCPPVQTVDNGFVVSAGTTSAIVCIQLYYYNSSTALTLNLTKALSIEALYYVRNGSLGIPVSFSGTSNFTISPSQSQLVIGGPTDENEGSVVAFAITANTGASGTYELGISGGYAWMLGSSEPLQCGYYGELVAGNGQPNYVSPTGCITYSTTSMSGTETTSSSSNYHTIPGIPYALLSGNLYFKVIGVMNPTQ
jgi:hypothetical protein